jgi:hypothetical protein
MKTGDLDERFGEQWISLPRKDKHMSLPTWVKLYVEKENEESHLLSQREIAIIHSLSIAWEALETIHEGTCDSDILVAQAALRRIEEIGK